MSLGFIFFVTVLHIVGKVRVFLAFSCVLCVRCVLRAGQTLTLSLSQTCLKHPHFPFFFCTHQQTHSCAVKKLWLSRTRKRGGCDSSLSRSRTARAM
jgi:hypothetical protein